MRLKFINPNDLDNNIKATIHKTGKLGFTHKAASSLGLKKGMSVSIGIDEDDRKSKNLFMVFNEEMKDESFKIVNIGGYFYAHTKALFDFLGVDYSGGNVYYDISPFNNNIYLLKRRMVNF